MNVYDQARLTVKIIVFGVILCLFLPVILGALLDFVDWVRGSWHDYTSDRNG